MNMDKKKEVWKMSDIGLFGAQFEISQDSLRAFDEAMGLIHKGQTANKIDSTKITSGLLTVLEPLKKGLKQIPSVAMGIDEHSLIEILRKKCESNQTCNWVLYQKEIENISARVQANVLTFSGKDIAILNDIGDALDAECNRYYRCLRGTES
jgi:hypothetical protein